VNDGSVPVTLVQPGDGSDAGWRTPTIDWKARSADGQPAAPSEGGRCGNMNRIHEDEIFVLPPGESRELQWLGEPRVQPGRYEVTLRYENAPRHPLSQRALGSRDAGTPVLTKIRRSTPCRLESNALTVTSPL
jgi:hypothetical protein